VGLEVGSGPHPDSPGWESLGSWVPVLAKAFAECFWSSHTPSRIQDTLSCQAWSLHPPGIPVGSPPRESRQGQESARDRGLGDFDPFPACATLWVCCVSLGTRRFCGSNCLVQLAKLPEDLDSDPHPHFPGDPTGSAKPRPSSPYLSKGEAPCPHHGCRW
jgi:hypothetical protein